MILGNTRTNGMQSEKDNGNPTTPHQRIQPRHPAYRPAARTSMRGPQRDLSAAISLLLERRRVVQLDYRNSHRRQGNRMAGSGAAAALSCAGDAK